MSQEPVVSSSAPSFEPPVHRVTTRKHFPGSQQQPWNFLRGEGPSSSEMYYASEKKSFKPGWQSMRQQPAIQQDKERLEATAIKAQREGVIRELKAERTYRCQDPNGFNPITGQPRRTAAANTSIAAQPRAGLRPAAAIHAVEASGKPDPKERAQSLANVYEIRKGSYCIKRSTHTTPGRWRSKLPELEPLGLGQSVNVPALGKPSFCDKQGAQVRAHRM